MLLTIDTARLEELSKSNQPTYIVTSSHLMGLDALPLTPPSSAVYGASFVSSGEAAPFDRQLQILRQRIVDSGMKLKTADAIDRELDEMRRRSL
jgi:hypothetical protein